MRLLSVHLKAFRQHADSYVEFPLGVSGVLGPNEVGKSGLAVEAVLFAFFGASACRGTKGSLRWNRAAPRQTASVTLRFELAGTTYRIERGESTARLFDEGAGTCLVDGVDALNKHSPVLLGMTTQELLSSAVVSQKDLSRISSMLPTERLSFIRRVLGHERIDVGLRNCRKRKAELADERRGLEAGLGAREPLADAAEQYVQTCGNAEAHRTDSHARAAVASGAFDSAHATLADSTTRKADHDRLTREAENAKTATTAAGLEITRLEEKAKQISAAKLTLAAGEVEVARLVPLRGQRDGLLAAKGAAGERAMLEARSATLRDESAALVTVVADLEACVAGFDPGELERAQADAKDANARLGHLTGTRDGTKARLTAEIQIHEKEAARNGKRLAAIVEAGQAGHCPTCTRELGDAYAVVVDTLEKERQEASDAAAKCITSARELMHPSDDEIQAQVDRDAAEAEQDRLTAIQRAWEATKKILPEKTAALRKALAELEQVSRRLVALPAVTFDPAALSSVEAEIRALEEKDAALARPRALVSQTAETAQLLADRRAMLALADAARHTATAGLDALRYDTAAHALIEAAHLRAQKVYEDARVALARAEEAERGAIERLGSARAALSEYDRKAERLNSVLADHLLHEKVDARLSAFRVAIAATVRPELEELTSGIVNLLTDGRHESVTITEDFQMVLNESGVPMEVTSGGTDDVAALAMRLALSQMITERSGHDLGLLVLDEPFTSLDETRRAGAMAMLRRLTTTFPQVLIVSHIPDVRDMVDHAIELEYSEAAGCTRVLA